MTEPTTQQQQAAERERDEELRALEENPDAGQGLPESEPEGAQSDTTAIKEAGSIGRPASTMRA